MSSWLSWLSLVINSMVPIISIQFLFKFCSTVAKNFAKYKQPIALNQPINNEIVCDRCKSVINKTKSSSAKNYHNKEQTKYHKFNDESFERCDVNGANQEYNNLSSSDDDQNIIGQVSTREVISYVGNDRQSENNKILEVCRTKNTVSKLRKQFENGSSGGGKKKMRNIERQISERFFKREPSPIKVATNVSAENEEARNEELKNEEQPNNDYYVIEKTKVYKVLNTNKENAKGAASGSDKLSKLLLSKRSHSNGDIKRVKKSPSHNAIAEEPIFPNGRTVSFDQINSDFDDIEDDIELRKKTAVNNRRSVRTFDDILQQERFSKCYSEYSISDLLTDLPDNDDDIEFTSFLNKIK